MTICSLNILLSQFELVHCSMSGSNCCFLTCIQISQEQVRWSGIPISWRIFHSFFVIHSVKGFKRIVNKREVDVFLEFSFFFDDPADAGNSTSDSSPFSKSSLNIWKFSVHILSLENFQHYFTSMWDECNCAVVWTFFGIAFLWDWNKPFPVLWPLLSFPNLLAYWV